MRKLFCAALLALTLSAPAASAQDSGSTTTTRKDVPQSAEKAPGQKAKSGTDCTRAGGRCNKPKPRKPWFFGKA